MEESPATVPLDIAFIDRTNTSVVQKMKTSLIFASALLLLFSPSLHSEDFSPLLKWRALSARSQNLHHELQRIRHDGAADPSMYEESLKKVGDALDELVTLNELVSKRITIKSLASSTKDEIASVSNLVQLIGEEYGFFVASEMCDLGGRLNFMTMMPGKPHELHLRLPGKYMKMFLDVAAPLASEN